MTSIIRTAKSGNDWGSNELIAFNIEIVREEPEKFFAQPLPERLDVPPAILDNLDEPERPTRAVTEFFAYLEDAIRIPPNEESFVDDFAVVVLKLMGYDERRRIIHTRKELTFEMCGSTVTAKTDVCVMERTAATCLLVLQEDKRHISVHDPAPQLIAEAIAAFSRNNQQRFSAGLDQIPQAVVPGITMVGSAPTFYKIPVTQDFLSAIATSTYPAEKTIVKQLVPPVLNRAAYIYEGMKPLQNRRIVLQCFQAFKPFMDWAA